MIRSLKKTDQQVVGKTVQASVKRDELCVDSFWETTSLVLHHASNSKKDLSANSTVAAPRVSSKI